MLYRTGVTERNRLRAMHRRGFTLIEVLIVIAILLVISGLVAVNLLPRREQADVDLTRVQMDRIAEALQFFRLDVRRFPEEEEGLAALWSQDAMMDEMAMEAWRGPYLETPIPRDPWGNEWIYRFPSEVRGEGHYDLISMGPDGEEGTEDDLSVHDRLGELDDEFGGFDDFDFGGP